MNVDLQYSMDFMGAVWYNGALQLNSYSVSLQLLTTSERAMITNVALERIKAFVLSELQDVVFINREHENEAEMFEALGCNVCTLPEEPVDQIVGIMLYCKLNAVTEGNLLITQLDISSSLGNEVWYQHHSDDNLGPLSQDGWWHKKNCQKHNLPQDTEHNVVKVETSGWSEYGLDWPDAQPQQKATVVKTDFKRHETNQTR